MRRSIETAEDTQGQTQGRRAQSTATRPTRAEAHDASCRVLTVPIADIAESPDNTRLFDTHDADERASLQELAASIKALGLQQYPKVRPHDGATPWVLVYGARRLRACRDILHWREIPVMVEEGLSREAAAAITAVENLQRHDLHPMDEARGLAILRGQGATITEIARRLGRRAEWVKERLKLCDLPPEVQDIYRHSAHMTLQQALGLHDYTHGGPDNRGFPNLMIALAQDMDSGANRDGYLGGIAAGKPHLVKRLYHASGNWDGTWGGNYFATKEVCTRCPFAAYREGSYGMGAFCLLPSHYEELQVKGKKKLEEARATAAQTSQDGPASPHATGRAPEPAKTPAQKGKETRDRHQKQRDAYLPAVAAIERAVDMIPAVDGIDVAVLCAYVLTTQHVEREAVQQVITRHGVTGFPGIEPTPTRQQIARLRAIAPVQLVRYTLEALLLTQARRARDYDPGKTPPDPVLALYLPAQATETTEDAA